MTGVVFKFNCGGSTSNKHSNLPNISSERPRNWLIAALVIGAVLVNCADIRAQGFLYFWNNPAGGSYNTGGNWSPFGVPNDNTEGAEFDLNATYTVTFLTNVGTSLAEVASGNVTFDLDSSGIPRTYTVQNLAVFGAAPTTLSVADGTVNATDSTLINGLMYLRPGGAVSTGTAAIGDTGNGYLSIQTTHQAVRRDGVFTSGDAALGQGATATGTVEVTGRWNSGALTVGNAGDGFLQILGVTTISSQIFTDAGRVTSTTASIAAQAGSTGSVQVHGMAFQNTSDTARWNVTDDLWVGGTDNGSGGEGTLSIEDLGEVTVGGFAAVWADGEVTVEDGGTWNAGSTGVYGGKVTIKSGGTFNLEPDAGINPADGGSFTVEDLYVLENGCFFKNGSGGTMDFPGGLNIRGGGIMHRGSGSRITAGDGVWGSNGTNAGVSVFNQAILETGNLTLAASNVADTEAHVSVFSGGDMTVNGTLSLAPAGGATTSAEISIDDAGSTFTQNDSSPTSISVGHAINGEAVINIRNGAYFTTGTGETHIRAHGMINLESSAVFDVRGTFRNEGQFNFLGGTMHVGPVVGNLVNTGGTLAPGHSAGQTSISGNFIQQNAATLEIEIGGTTQSTQYDFVSVARNATVGGELELKIINGFVPAATDLLTVLDANSAITGTFSNVASGQRLMTMDGIGSFLVHYGVGSVNNPNQLILSAFQLVPVSGDYNQNGVVDAADYVVWRKSLGLTGTGLAADGDGNGEVNAADYDFWKAHFGQTTASAMGAAIMTVTSAIPEPSSIALLCAAVACFFCRTRRIRRNETIAG